VMALVRRYDGHKPLIDIVEDSPFKAFDTIKITYRLAELGAIVRRETHLAEPLSSRLAVRDWLLGSQESARGERPRPGVASGVTEAGRRAAEAYAAEQAQRADAPSPADEILDGEPPAGIGGAAADLRAANAALRAALDAPPAEAPPPAKAKKKTKKEKAPHKESAKLSPQAAAAAPVKENAFNPVEEDFFAREADLWRAAPVDSFDDLDADRATKK
jgi:hypothetical protein